MRNSFHTHSALKAVTASTTRVTSLDIYQMVAWNAWDALITRSKSAATESNWVRSKLDWLTLMASIRPVIPQRVLDRPPSAELAPDQKDEDSLPPYSVLDPILEGYIEQDLGIHELIKRGFEEDVVRRVATLVDRNEYKRRQAPPGVRITRRAFGRDRRYPITSGFLSAQLRGD